MSKTATIGRTDLAGAIAKEFELSNAKSIQIIGFLVKEIQENVRKGKKVTITGFGTFQSKKRAARKGRNPFSGEAIKIKANTVPTFKAGAGFKAIVGRK